MNPVLSTIKERYSCKSYAGNLPSDVDLRLIAEAAVQSPSAMNRQWWRVIVVKNRALIDEMESEGLMILEAMPDKSLYDRVMARGKGLYYGAPCMIIVPIDATQPVGAALDCGILCQNITLAATSLGVDNLICGLAGLAFAGEKATHFKEKMGFPEGYEFGAAVLLGYAEKKTAPHLPDYTKISWIE